MTPTAAACPQWRALSGTRLNLEMHGCTLDLKGLDDTAESVQGWGERGASWETEHVAALAAVWRNERQAERAYDRLTSPAHQRCIDVREARIARNRHSIQDVRVDVAPYATIGDESIMYRTALNQTLYYRVGRAVGILYTFEPQYRYLSIAPERFRALAETLAARGARAQGLQ